MNRDKTLRRVMAGLFSAFMLFSALGELTLNSELVRSMTTLGYPLYLLPLLGALKVAGVVTLLAPRLNRLKEWAYAGFVFDLGGAIFSIVATQAWFLSDAIAAPIGLALCAASYYFYRRSTALVPNTLATLSRA